MSLAVTIETAMCIIFPLRFRIICTKRLSFSIFLVALILSFCLHIAFISFYDIRQTVFISISEVGNKKCYLNAIRYMMRISEDSVFGKIYYWILMMLAIVLPTLLMLFCTIVIVCQVSLKAIFILLFFLIQKT